VHIISPCTERMSVCINEDEIYIYLFSLLFCLLTVTAYNTRNLKIRMHICVLLKFKKRTSLLYSCIRGLPPRHDGRTPQGSHKQTKSNLCNVAEGQEMPRPGPMRAWRHSRCFGKAGGNTVITAHGERANSPPTVAASLFCYMDDEVDVWVPSMRRTATVFLPNDE